MYLNTITVPTITFGTAYSALRGRTIIYRRYPAINFAVFHSYCVSRALNLVETPHFEGPAR